jgi:hypothetical protein
MLINKETPNKALLRGSLPILFANGRNVILPFVSDGEVRQVFETDFKADVADETRQENIRICGYFYFVHCAACRTFIFSFSDTTSTLSSYKRYGKRQKS